MQNSILIQQGLSEMAAGLCSHMASQRAVNEAAAEFEGVGCQTGEATPAAMPCENAVEHIRMGVTGGGSSPDVRASATSHAGTSPLYMSGLHRSPEEVAGDGTGAAPSRIGLERAVQSARKAINDGYDALFGLGGSVATTIQESAARFTGVGAQGQRGDLCSKIGLAALLSFGLATACNAGASEGSSELTNVLLKAVFSNVMGGLGIFMLGLKLMNAGLQSVSDEGLKRVLKKLTDNRLAALAIGTGVTAVIQSSSVTSVLSLSFVDAGMMTLRQAMAVNIGANIGTTATGLLFALKIAKYGLFIIGTGMIPYLFLNRTERIENIGKTVFGLGAVFLGLTTMSAGFKDPVVRDYLHSFFSTMSGDTYAGIGGCIIAAAVATAIVQSSSATLGVIIALAKTGVIPFETAAALIIGSNVGTTVTAGLAAVRSGTSLDARRVAAAHFLFNVIGALSLYPVSPQYIHGLKNLMESSGVEDIGAQVALSHMVFNGLGAFVAIAALGPFEKLVRTVLPDSLAKQQGVARHLSNILLDNPPLAAEVLHKEIVDMGGDVREALDALYKVYAHPGPKIKKGKRVVEVEKRHDLLQWELINALNKLATKGKPRAVADQLAAYRRMVNELESMSDDVSKLLTAYRTIRGSERDVADEARKDLLEIHHAVTAYTARVLRLVKRNGEIAKAGDTRSEFFPEMKEERDHIVHMIEEAGDRHEERLRDGSDEGGISVKFTDMLGLYRTFVGRVKNVADAAMGGKPVKAPYRRRGDVTRVDS